jgi:hypothetical protein
VAEVTEYGSPEAATQQLSVNGDQLEDLVSRLVAAVRQTGPPLSRSQQDGVLRFRLLRNGLGRFHSPSEGYDRSLIRMRQIWYGDDSRLVIDDPLPSEVYSMVVVVDSDRRPTNEVPTRGDEVPTYGFIELVEFLDRLGVPVAAGVPVQLAAPPVDARKSRSSRSAPTVQDSGS